MTDEYFLNRRLVHSFRAAATALRSIWEDALKTGDIAERDRVLAGLYGATLRECHVFCETVSRQQEDGYRFGSEVVCACLSRDYVPPEDRPDGWSFVESRAFKPEDGQPDPRLLYGLPREVRSVMLTAFTMWPYMLKRGTGEALRGRRVAHIARVLNRTADRCARVYVEWFEDMGGGIPPFSADPSAPYGGDSWILSPQPTRVLRGILFATRLERDGVMDPFWKLAARSPKFPERIFTDPGDHRNCDCLMSPSQFAQLAQFCTHAPEEAVRRFLGAYRDAVSRMKSITYGRAMLSGASIVEVSGCDIGPGTALDLFPDCGINPAFVCDGDLKRVDLEVTPEKRTWLLERAVLTHIHDAERRKLACEILFPDGRDRNDRG